MNSFSVKLAANLLILTIGLAGVYLAQPVLIPLLLAGLASILLNPTVEFLHRKLKLPLGLAAPLTLLGSVVVVGGILLLMSQQVRSLSDDWPQIKHHAQTMYQQLQDWIHSTFRISYHKQQSYVQEAADKFLQNGGYILSGTLGTFSSVFFKGILALFYTLLILLYRNLILTFLSKVVRPSNHAILYDILYHVKTVVSGYIIGLVIEMAIVTLMLWMGMFILGVKYAFFLALFTAILNLIPYIGIWIGTLVSLAFTLGTSANWGTLLEVFIVFAATHLIDANLLITRVVSSKIKINALASLLGVILGATLWGIWGTFLALPTIAVLKVIMDRIPALEPWGYLLGDEIPKKFSWQDLIKKNAPTKASS